MSKIEWCDITINPIVGCSKCSPGCDNCYAERMAARWAKHPNPKISRKYAGVVDEHGKWTGQVNEAWGYNSLPHGTPGKEKRVFIGSMTDLFHSNVDNAQIDEIFASILFDLIVTNGHRHTYIILSKRVDRMLEYFSPGPEAMLRRWGKAGDGWLHVGDGDETFSEYAEGQTIPQPGHEKHPNLLHEYLWPLPNLWCLATICNQPEADEKIPLLLQVPAIKRGVSVEPMLGPVDLSHMDADASGHEWCWINALTGRHTDMGRPCPDVPKLDWVICGGETGPRARPMHPDWVRSLRDQCQEAGVPFFFKGWGEYLPLVEASNPRPYDYLPEDLKTGRYTHPLKLNWITPEGYDFNNNPWREKSSDWWRRDRAENEWWTFKAGKKRAGRLLDGVQWNEVPV